MSLLGAQSEGPLAGSAAERLANMTREFGEYGGVNASIENSTTFTVLRAHTMQDIFTGTKGHIEGCYLYGRSFNPTVRYLGRQLAALEGTEAGYATSSGMAAISSVLLHFCNSGDHVVASNAVYGGTFALLKDFLPRKANITTSFVPINDLSAVEKAIGSKTKVLYTETVSNPTLVVADLEALSTLAKKKGIKFVVDNTFTPMILSPAKWGADVVVHSMTKFISGASDVIAGAICGTAKTINALMDLHLGPVMLLGPTLEPKTASDLHLRIPHLGLRMAEHSRRALACAKLLSMAGAKVVYPGLPDHPQHHLLAKLRNNEYGWGGLLTIDMGSQKAAGIFMERLQNKHGFGFMAVSLGYFDTLMSCSGATTSSELSEDERLSAGIPPGLVRLSVGITGSLESRCEQLLEAYEACTSALSGDVPRFPYRAAQVVKNEHGKLARIASWDSLGDALNSSIVEDVTKSDLDEPSEDGRPRKLCRTGLQMLLFEQVVAGASPGSQDTTFSA
eukprot:jgi/Botrbrau1/7102/Bobra.0165s0123.1